MGKTRYIISTGGLPVGNHEFQFEVTDAFFKDTDTEELNGVDVSVKAILLKQNNVMQLQFELSGTVNINCDRCLKEFDIPVEGTEHLIIKYGNPSDSTDEVLMVHEGETQLDVTQYIYEYVITAVPARKVPCEIDSKKYKCDKALLKKLNENSISVESIEENPLWEQLNKLKNNKN